MSEKSPAPSSLVAQLRAERKKIKADTYKVLPVPGWDSLVVRYKRLPWETFKPLAEQLGSASDSTQELSAAIEMLIEACDEVLFVIEGEAQSLEDPIRAFDQRLAELIGEDADTAPEVINIVFPDDLAVITTAGEYMTWLSRSEGKVDELLGKLSGKTAD